LVERLGSAMATAEVQTTGYLRGHSELPECFLYPEQVGHKSRWVMRVDMPVDVGVRDLEASDFGN
jgi:hypothetical protein